MSNIGESCTQELTLVLRADNGFWRTYPETDSFAFSYEDTTETFNYDTEADGDLGENWPLCCTEEGGGFIYADGSQARWKDDPDDWLITDTREVVAGPYKDFQTATNNQVVSMVIGSFQEWSLPEGAANDLWARMGRNPDGSWDGNGIRMRIENNILTSSAVPPFSPFANRLHCNPSPSGALDRRHPGISLRTPEAPSAEALGAAAMSEYGPQATTQTLRSNETNGDTIDSARGDGSNHRW
ncbi:Gp15 [Mycolicibacterium smegmatis]|nr:Gp15 [Mycolicibacterium smegmatis]